MDNSDVGYTHFTSHILYTHVHITWIHDIHTSLKSLNRTAGMYEHKQKKERNKQQQQHIHTDTINNHNNKN